MSGSDLPQERRTAGTWLALIASIALLPLIAGGWLAWREWGEDRPAAEPAPPPGIVDAASLQILMTMLRTCREPGDQTYEACIEAFAAEHPIPTPVSPPGGRR